MKTTRSVFGIPTIAMALAGFTLPVTVQSQIYTLSTPVSGTVSMSVMDTGGSQLAGGTVMLNFTTLSETVYLDTVRGTIRQVGLISVTPSPIPPIVLHETQQFGKFPNPVTNVQADVTVTFTLSEGGFSFDTGPRPLSTLSQSRYAFDGSFSVPIHGSYSLATSGNTNAGQVSYTLFSYNANYTASTFNRVSITSYPASISLSGLAIYGGSAAIMDPIPFVAMADITATNGFHMLLWPGYYGYETIHYGGELWSWSSPAVTATQATNSPAITEQPQSVVVHAHDTTSFSVAASGTVPLSYQWSLNSTNIPGATSSGLTISNVDQSDLGSYAVTITNGVGSVTSSNAILSMYPFLAVPFGGVVTAWGQDTTLSVQAWGTGPLSYQWFDNGGAILNATNQTLTLASIQFTNAGLYSVVVSSLLGSVTNIPEQVVVNPAGVSIGMFPGITVSGTVGYTYSIQATSDLSKTNWVSVATLTLIQPVQLWVDINVNALSPTNPHRFYRVVPGD
jgi:hypothetical protein